MQRVLRLPWLRQRKSNSPSSNPTRASIPYGCNKQGWIHATNVCFQLWKATVPPNPTQVSAATKDPAAPGGNQASQILLCTVLQVYAHRVMMWFRLEGAFGGLSSNPLLKACQLAQGLAQVSWEYLLGW